MLTFEKLYMREDARDLYTYLHELFEKKKNKDDFFKTEMLRWVLLIGGTIAQWYEINLGDVKWHLTEAKWFCGVVKNLAYIGEKIWYFDSTELEEILGKCSKIAAGIYKFTTAKKKAD